MSDVTVMGITVTVHLTGAFSALPPLFDMVIQCSEKIQRIGAKDALESSSKAFSKRKPVGSIKFNGSILT